jgi:hypothetical protein
MSTNKVDLPASPHSTAIAPASPPPSSPARLALLVGLLVAAIGALAYDYLVAKPGCDAAYKKIQEFVDAQNKLGVKEGALITPDAMHKELGMQPTWVEKHDDQNYEVEYYCWWGNVPVFNTRRHFISVVYNGKEPRHFSSHHHNESPPDEALPVVHQPTPQSEEASPAPSSKDAGGAEGAEGTSPAAADAPAAETKSANDTKPAEETKPAAAEPAPAKDN